MASDLATLLTKLPWPLLADHVLVKPQSDGVMLGRILRHVLVQPDSVDLLKEAVHACLVRGFYRELISAITQRASTLTPAVWAALISAIFATPGPGDLFEACEPWELKALFVVHDGASSNLMLQRVFDTTDFPMWAKYKVLARLFEALAFDPYFLVILRTIKSYQYLLGREAAGLASQRIAKMIVPVTPAPSMENDDLVALFFGRMKNDPLCGSVAPVLYAKYLDAGRL